MAVPLSRGARFHSAEAGETGSSAARLILIATLFLGPLALGAVQPWAWSATSLMVVLAFIVWAWAGVRSGVLRLVWTPLHVPAAAFFLLALLQFSAHRTADPIATRESLVKLATDLLIFFLAVQFWTARSVQTNRRFGSMIVIFTCALALFGILQFFASPGMIYGIVKPRWHGWIFGPYVNHNHYAGLAEMLIPIALCYFLSPRAGSERDSRRVLTAFTVIVGAASLLLSGSRGGLIALASEIILLTVILWRRQPSLSGRGFTVAGLAGVGAVALLFLWLDPGQISSRLGSIADITRAPDVSVAQRHLVARDSLRVFKDHRWIGTGLGSFATVYPRYRSFPSDLEWDHAHNDYAEALAETGTVGAGVILSALVLFFLLAFHNLNERLQTGVGWIGLGAALGCCGLLVHGLADFNFHIPANAAWFSFSAGLAVAPARLGRKPVGG